MAKVLFLLLSAAALAHAANIKDCGSKDATVDFANLVVTGCTSSSVPCIFEKGKEASISLPFTPKFQVRRVRAQVHGVIHGVAIPFKLNNANGCVGSGLQCPLNAGQEYTYTARLPVRSIYPSISLDVKWELLDERSKPLVCILIPVQLKENTA
ncbi:NPC intracellular cholesterol transporter 2 homolog a-like [Portunus trituberculatus]|uniref:NPC intracellular cholesterol transporter 2 homolog a-like n=1 Tax=Portunus trituberculatus TaxID=210409 RepID=UPI001E1D1821|nr:NPC intracellular cholesterol transporter 2 homolog a-like [Portunus trituberculatus]